MHFPIPHPQRNQTLPTGALPGESPALLRELIRIYAEKLHTVTAHISAALVFREELPGVCALFTSLSRIEAGALHELGALLQNIQIPALPEEDRKPPYAESMQERARIHLAMLCDAYRLRAPHYRRVARLAHTERAREVLTSLARAAEEHATALSAMHARLSRS